MPAGRLAPVDRTRELRALAAQAEQWAPWLCADTGCAWYHGTWPWLRSLGLMSGAEVHAPFYREELARTAPRRVLISGSVDYGMLELLATGGGVSLDYTVLDVCATPLRICEWYAERHDLRLTTRRQDVLSPADFEPFDFICTHSFLGYFSEAERRSLIAQWAGWLAPGGRLVIVQPVREHITTETLGFSPAEVAAFESCIAGYVAQEPELPRDLAARARSYAEQLVVRPVRSASILRASFEGAGLQLERFEAETATGPTGLSGPTVPTGRSFHLITALKR